MFGASFDSTKQSLKDLLDQVDSGEMQLPDFQRSWVWDDARIRSLLASISVSFPIGAIMTLETGGEASFLPRAIEGAGPHSKEPDTLLLDGQQRMTSLYQALITKDPVRTQDARGKIVHRYYYVDMAKALSEDTDRDDWIVSVPDDRKQRSLHDVKLDLSTPEREYKEGFFPLDQVFAAASWRRAFGEYWRTRKLDKSEFYDEFEERIIERFKGYQLPVIELGKNTSKEAVCLVFEKVNTGGVTLNVFELVTASFAADDYRLREDWAQRSARLRDRRAVLASLESDQFLQVVALLATLDRRRAAVVQNPGDDRLPAVGCRRRDILGLSLEDYLRWAPAAEQGLAAAGEFLELQHIFRPADVPYQTQLVPLAAIFADLGQKGQAGAPYEKIVRWFWCGVLGEMYAGSVETMFARDLIEILEWIGGSDNLPSTIRDANFQANRLLTLRTRNSAAYKGIYALLMHAGSHDFRTGKPLLFQTFDDEAIDIHHIFPRKWCDQQAPPIPSSKYNSIINKTAISAQTNRIIGGNAPSSYLPALQDKFEIGQAQLDKTLESHHIQPDRLRADAFWEFYAARAESLLCLIEEAMGKAITRDRSAFAVDAPVEEYSDGPLEYGADAAS